MAEHRNRGVWPVSAQVAVGVLLVLGGGVIVVDTQSTKARVESSQSCNVAAFEDLQRSLIARSQVTSDERAVDSRLVRDLLANEGPEGVAQRRAARREWIDASNQLDQERQARPYPPVRSCQPQ